MNTGQPILPALISILMLTAVVVAVAVTAVSAATALQLTGVPDPGAITTYGGPAITVIGQIAASVAFGAAVFAAFFVPPQEDGVLDVGGYRAIRWAATGAVTWAICSVVMIPFSISNVSGQPLSLIIQPSNLVTAYPQVAEARYWLWTAIFAIAAAGVARVVMRWGWTFVVIGLMFLSFMPPALMGHSAGGGDHDVATNSLIIHIVGAALWLGGLVVVLVYAFASGRWRNLAVRRYSRVALWCLIAVGASGVINALVRIDFGDLVTTTYGALVLVKLALLIVIGGLGAWHRKVTIAALEKDRQPERSLFVRFAVIESLVFAATFGVAVGLGRTPPPRPEDPALTSADVILGYDFDGRPTFARLLFDWRFDIIFGTLAVLLAVFYLLGVRRLHRRGDAWPWGRTLAWILGCLVLLLATSSGFGRYSTAMFSTHMMSHMMLSMMAPVLLVLGGPVTLALRAIPPAGRGNPPGPREWLLSGIHSPYSRFMTHPIIATALFVGSFYLLYLGGIFEAVVRHHSAHLVMNLHFLVSGFLFYWLTIGIDPAPRQINHVAKLGLVWGSLPLHAFFGVALMMTTGIIAEQYYRALQLDWHTDLFGDQRVGGGIAWATGEFPLVVVMLALLVQWHRSDERMAKRFDRAEERAQDSELDSYNAMLAGLNRPGTKPARAEQTASAAAETRQPVGADGDPDEPGGPDSNPDGPDGSTAELSTDPR